jgi:hypothetical protein
MIKIGKTFGISDFRTNDKDREKERIIARKMLSRPGARVFADRVLSKQRREGER